MVVGVRCDRCGEWVRLEPREWGRRGLVLVDVYSDLDTRNAGTATVLCDGCLDSFGAWLLGGGADA